MKIRTLKQWEDAGRPIPIPHVAKQKVVAEYKDVFKYNVFIETGTYTGAMVKAMLGRFERIYSIELGVRYYLAAVKMFIGHKHVRLFQGDSGRLLPRVLKAVKEPAIFWLDAHYSGGRTARGDLQCPIIGELDAIFDHGEYNHVLLIDDARSFNGTNDFPTLSELSAYILQKHRGCDIIEKDDIIRCVIRY